MTRKTSEPGLLLLIDAGASHTRAVVATTAGGILGRAQAGPGNPFAVGAKDAAAHLCQASHSALAGARLRPSAIGVVVAGCAGIGYAGQGRRPLAALLKREFPAARVRVEADVLMAWHAALAGRLGVVIVSGTGSIVLGGVPGGALGGASGNSRGVFVRAGGWGWLLGDEGSAQWIGRQAVSAAASAFDRMAPATRLAPMLLRQLRLRSFDRIADRLYRPPWTPAQWGTLAPLVTQAAQSGDRVARAILRRGAESLAAQAIAVVRRLGVDSPPISYHGSVFSAGPLILAPLRRALRRHDPRLRFVAPALPPLGGAFQWALELLGESMSNPAPRAALAAFAQDLSSRL